MSMYNMMNGATSATFLILPMLGKHPDEYPRFRDCFIADEEQGIEQAIIVYTRTGGGNREAYEKENAVLQAMKGYQQDYDDTVDSTYACFVFDIPEEFKADFDLVMVGKFDETSEAYQKKLYEVYPKLSEKWDEAFKK